jgi:hypothetical protein
MFLGMGFELSAIDNGMSKMFEKMADTYKNMVDSMAKKSEKWALGTGHMIGRVIIQYKRLEPTLLSIKGVSKSVFSGMITGFNGVVSGIGMGVVAIGGSFKKLYDGTKKTFRKMSDIAMKFNVADIASQMRGLTGETGDLTNSLEATMVGMMQSTKPIAASLNLSSKEMAKFSSQAAGMAYGMNTSADAVAETMRSIFIANKGAKEAMESLSMSTKDWVKIVQTTNVPMSEFTAILGDMTTSWQASPKEAAKMLDNLVAIGKAAGTGTGALKNAKVQLDELGELFKTLPPSMARSSDEIIKLMESSARMSGVFREMGDTQEEAITKANTVARMFAEQDVEIQKALSIGNNKALMDNPLLKYLMRLGVGFDEARNIISIGSRDTVAGMKKINDIYTRFGDDVSPQVQRALSDLSGALGEGAAGLSYLAANTIQGSNALNKMANLAIKGSGSLRQFGKDAYSSGLTLQETYDRAKLSFDTTIRSIARGDVRGIVKKQIRGMREAGKEIKALGSDETWGPWVNALSRFKQMGIGGIFSSIAESTGVGVENASKFGAKAGLVFDTVKQFGSELAPLMQLFGMTGPLGPLIAAGGIGSLFVLDDTSAKDILGPFYDMFSNFKKMVNGLWDDFSDKFIDVWDKKISPKLMSFWDKAIIPFMEDYVPKIGQIFLDGLKWAWDEFWKTDVEKALDMAEKIRRGEINVSDLSKRDIEKITSKNKSVIKEQEGALGLIQNMGMMSAGPFAAGAAWASAPKTTSTIKKIKQSQQSIDSSLGMDWVNWDTEPVTRGGETTANAFVDGMTSTLDNSKEKIDESFGYAAEGGMSRSPIKSGPLSGEGENNAVYRGGYWTMEQFALGVTSSTEMIRSAVDSALNESVIMTIDEYATKMRDLAEQKTFLASVAKSIIRDLGMDIETTVDSNADVNVKKNLEAALSVPGLASVVLAVSNEGAQTRKLLKRILDENVKQTSIMSSKSVSGNTGLVTTAPPPS